MAKHRTTVFLETDMLNAIRKVAKADERPMAYHYDKALRAYGPIKKLMAKPVKSMPVHVANDLVNIPAGINRQAWQEWVEAKGSKLTKAAKTKQWKLLLNYGEPEQQAIIDVSINSGWQGLFALKGVQKPAEDFIKKHTNRAWADGI